MKILVCALCALLGLSYGFALSGCAQAVAATVNKTATWTAPTLNTDGSAITDAITYNVYAGASGKETLLKSGVTAPTLSVATTAGTATCVQITSVVDTVESARTPEVCVTSSFPTPDPPSAVTLK